ncbi:cupin domain-containing protein [Shewanella loihica]|uniref:Cupin 2, conserved barrel domain protein n=1 Tax=Shewanella loihica (strain ATCC BAA-1088 / PV-4) TaxID=323850 RepID=A3QGD0_SHELP|nr:cupin domain-containing protein [Shewanella loihica]ABO24528.1 Cupin 2, conserved barrel domain protein [Shewanella loihica PV-4]
MKVVSRDNSEHYLWGEQDMEGKACDGWHLVKRPALSVILERVPVGRGEQRHYHKVAEQFFFILSGTALLEVEGSEHRLTAHQGMHVAPGQAHCLRNGGEQVLEFLVTSTPPSHGDREKA